MTNKALISVEQKEVVFYDDILIAIRADDSHVYVSLRQMCDALGMDRTAQVRRIRRQPILEEGLQGGVIMAPPSADGRGGGKQKANLLRVDLVPLWLSGIDTKRVKEQIRAKLEKYQREAAKVLWEAFQSGRLTTDPTFDELLNTNSPAAQAVLMAQAVLKIAQQQLLLESRLDVYDERLEAVEAQLGNSARMITIRQAEKISQAVKAIALELGHRTKRNEHGGVYGEVYRTYGITSYKELPASKYEECVGWLNDWYKSLVDDVVF